MDPDRLPDFQVELPASNYGHAGGDRGLVLADLPGTTTRRLSISLQSGLRFHRGRIGDAVALREGLERSTMEDQASAAEASIRT